MATKKAAVAEPRYTAGGKDYTLEALARMLFDDLPPAERAAKYSWLKEAPKHMGGEKGKIIIEQVAADVLKAKAKRKKSA